MNHTTNLLTILNQAREESGLSYGNLAKRAHASPGSLHRILHGTDHPRRNTLIRVCVALNFDVERTNRALRLAHLPDLESE